MASIVRVYGRVDATGIGDNAVFGVTRLPYKAALTWFDDLALTALIAWAFICVDAALDVVLDDSR